MSTFGEDLKRERELRNISLREISEATKVSVRHLEALERNDFEHLPGGVFNRGFVRAYAQFIGVDPEAMVNAYLLEQRSQQSGYGGDAALLRGRRAGIVTPDGAAAPGSPTGGSRGRRIVLFVFVVVALTLAATAVWWFTRDVSESAGRRTDGSIAIDSAATAPEAT